MAEITTPMQIRIYDDGYAFVASQFGSRMAGQVGFTKVEQTALSTAILEIARNAAKYAVGGIVTLKLLNEEGRVGIEVISTDTGPGIADISLALQDGYSTGKGLGRGLPGAKRLMDSFEITSQPGVGTTITMKKWKK